jgi:hypothetical protein
MNLNSKTAAITAFAISIILACLTTLAILRFTGPCTPPPPERVIAAEPCCFKGKPFLRIKGLMDDGSVVWMPTKAEYCWAEAPECQP